MRQINLRYAGECRKCSEILSVGATAIYEKHVGVFCPSCAPTNSEEIRAYRQEAADRRADKYEEWADKRREKAESLEARNEPYQGDIAFNTQPGHIPERARANARSKLAFEHMETATRFEEKAECLRKVRVAGDAETKRQAQREVIRAILKIGMSVDTGIYGHGIVEKINKKTATIGSTGTSGTYKTTVDLSFIRPL